MSSGAWQEGCGWMGHLSEKKKISHAALQGDSVFPAFLQRCIFIVPPHVGPPHGLMVP